MMPQLCGSYQLHGWVGWLGHRHEHDVVVVTSSTTVSDERLGYRRQLFDLLGTKLLPLLPRRK